MSAHVVELPCSGPAFFEGLNLKRGLEFTGDPTVRMAELLAMRLEEYVRCGDPLLVRRPASPRQWLAPTWPWAEALIAAGVHPYSLWVASAEFAGSEASISALVRRHMRGEAIGWLRRGAAIRSRFSKTSFMKAAPRRNEDCSPLRPRGGAGAPTDMPIPLESGGRLTRTEARW